MTIHTPRPLPWGFLLVGPVIFRLRYSREKAAQRMSEMLSHSTHDTANRPRLPIVELLILAAPAVAQQASYTVLQFTDTYMLTRVSDLDATAAGNAGMLAFSIIGLGMGVTMLVNTLVSQAYGRKDNVSAGQYLWQGLWFALVYSLITMPAILVAHLPFDWSAHEPELIWRETSYFRIAVLGTGLKLGAVACGQFMVAVNHPG